MSEEFDLIGKAITILDAVEDKIVQIPHTGGPSVRIPQNSDASHVVDVPVGPGFSDTKRVKDIAMRAGVPVVFRHRVEISKS